ncbi:unnamed protein product, partial [Closterium sp. NIES-53]
FRAEHSTTTRLLATVVTDPLFESAAASALVIELVDFAAHCRLDYAASLVAESKSVCPPSVGGECALGTDVLEDSQEDLECLAAAAPHLVSMLLAPERDPDAPDIHTPRSYAEAIAGEYSSQWQTAMDAEMASWKSTGTYVDEVPLPGTNIVSGMWIFRRDYELHSLDFSTTFLQGSLHEEIWLRRPPGFTGSFPPGTQWSLRRPVYGLRQAPREWHDTLRTTLAALGFAPSNDDPSLFLRTDTSLPLFYILVYVDDLVFASADTEAFALVLQHFGFTWSSAQATPLSTGHSLSAPPSDESVEPSGPYPELVGCLMHLMTCTRPDLAYPLGLLACYVAPGRHRKVHMDAAKRVLRYLCSTSGMGLVLGGRVGCLLPLPASPQQNGITERRMGMVMDVALHCASDQPLASCSLPETTPTLRWTGKVGNASAFRVWASRAFVRDTTSDKLSSRAVPCVFLGFPPDAPGWQFYHPTSRRVLSSQDVTFDESVSYYRLFPYRTASPPPPPLFLAPDPSKPVEVAVDSGAESGGAEPAGAGTGGAESGRAEPGGAERGVEPEGTASRAPLSTAAS